MDIDSFKKWPGKEKKDPWRFAHVKYSKGEKKVVGLEEVTQIKPKNNSIKEEVALDQVEKNAVT